MKKRLVIEYKDGSRLKITSTRCRDEKDNSMFEGYKENFKYRLHRIQNARIDTYPLKNHTPFVLVENGVSLQQNVDEFMQG